MDRQERLQRIIGRSLPPVVLASWLFLPWLFFLLGSEFPTPEHYRELSFFGSTRFIGGEQGDLLHWVHLLSLVYLFCAVVVFIPKKYLYWGKKP
jgi:hypothetical protein